jgi:PAS domain S-box-containing protein
VLICPFFIYSGSERQLFYLLDGHDENFELYFMNNFRKIIPHKWLQRSRQKSLDSRELLDASDQKQAHRALSESEERYRMLVELSPETIVVHSEGKLVYVNPAGVRLMGVDYPEQLLGLPVMDMLPPETRQQNLEMLAQIAQGKALPPLEQMIFKPDGSIVEVEMMCAAVLFQGKPAFQLIVRNITERKQEIEALRESEERYRRLFEGISLGVFQSSPEGKALAVNAAFARMFGYISAEEVVSTVQNVAREIFADPNRREEIARSVQENPANNTFENIYRRKDGSTFPGTLHLHPVKDRAGRLAYFEGLIDDISERKRSEVQIQESETRIRALVEAAPLGLHQYELLPDGKLIFRGANPSADHILGINHQELIGLPIEDAFPAHRQSEIPSLYRQVALAGVPYFCEQVAYQDNQIRGVFEIHAFQTAPSHMAVFFQDITEKKKAEEALRESEQKFRTLIEQNSEGVILYDERGRVIEWNAAQERNSGISSQEALGRPVWDLQFEALPPDQRSPDRYERLKAQGINLLQTGQSPIFYHPIEISIYRPDGRQVFIQQTAFPIKTNAGFRIGSIMRDITDRKQAELDLQRRMDEMEALRAVALAGTEAVSTDDLLNRVAGIVHEQLYPDHFGIALLDEKAQVLIYHPSFNPGPYLASSIVPLDCGISGAVARSGTLKRVADVQLDPDYLDVFPGIRSELCVPLKIGLRVIGVINLQKTTPDSFSEADERLVTAIASELSTALEKIRLLEAEQNRRKELEALEKISAVLRTEDNKDQALQAALERVMAVMVLQAAGIVLRDPESGDWVAEMGLGEWGFEKGMHLPSDEAISQQVASSQHYYLDNEVDPDPGLLLPDSLVWTRAFLCLALIVDGETQGLLYLGRASSFLPADIHLAIAMADVLAGTLHRMNLHEQTRRQLERLTALRAIDQSILSRLDMEITLEVLLEQITTQLQVDAANILLYQPDRQVLVPTAERGVRSKLYWDGSMVLRDTHAGRVALNRKMEIIADLSQMDDYLFAKVRRLGDDFIGFAAVPLVARGELKGVLQIFHRSQLKPTRDWLDFLDALADQAAIAINSALLFNQQQQTNARLTKAYEDTIDGWSRALDLRDEETEGHSQRVTELTLELARRLDIPEEQLVHIRRGAQLHDIGKMGVRDSILLKPDTLTEEEWVLMRCHPTFARNLLAPIEFLGPAVEIPYGHHEKWDGSGYPQGLKGEEIPFSARIFAVIDVWDALTHDRWYRKAWPTEKAFDYIRLQSGRHFDPQVVQKFLEMIDE